MVFLDFQVYRGLGSPAMVNRPTEICVWKNQAYFSDNSNNRIRKLDGVQALYLLSQGMVFGH